MAEEFVAKNFELVYQGPADESPRTLQRIKGVFVADLELPIPEIQRILENAPLTIQTAESEDSLKKAYKLLRSAGAKVLIVAVQPVDAAADSARADSVSSTEEQNAAPDESSGEEETAFEFILDDSLEMPAQTPPQKKPTKIYTLELDSNEEAPASDFEAPAQDIAFKPPEFEPSAGKSSEKPENPLMTMLERDELDTFLNQKEKGPESPSGDAASQGLAINATAQEQHSRLAEFEAIALEIQDNTPKPVAQALPDEMREAVSPDSGMPELETALTQPSAPVEPPKDDKPCPDKGPPSQELEFTSPSDFSLEDIEPLPPEPAAPAASAELSETEEPQIPPSVAPILTGEATTPDSDAPATPPIFVHQETPAETPVDSPLSTAARQRPNRRTSNYLAEVLLPVLVGAATLAAANWYYFSFSPQLPVLPEFFLMQDSDTPSSPAVASKATASPKKAPPADVYTASAAYDSWDLKAVFSMRQKQIDSASVTVTTTPPPELSKEDIVAGRVRAPWLRRIQAANIRFTQSTDGQYTGQGAALAYIEHQGKQLRLAGTAQLRAAAGQKKGVVSSSIVLQSKDISQPLDIPFKFEQNETGNFTFYVSASVTTGSTLFAPAH